MKALRNGAVAKPQIFGLLFCNSPLTFRLWPNNFQDRCYIFLRLWLRLLPKPGVVVIAQVPVAILNPNEYFPNLTSRLYLSRFFAPLDHLSYFNKDGLIKICKAEKLSGFSKNNGG
jgi:hypothetical protein